MKLQKFYMERSSKNLRKKKARFQNLPEIKIKLSDIENGINLWDF